MSIKNHAKRLLYKYPKLYKYAQSIYFYIKKVAYYTFFILFRVFSINNNKIIINNFYGTDYGDNGKYITEELLNKNSKYKIIWIIKKELWYKNTIPKSVTAVKYGSLLYIYHMATAKVWIDNCRLQKDVLKRSRQIYIQTWHGTLALKKIEGDAPPGSLCENYISRAKRDSQLADIFISNSRFLTNLYKNAFWYQGMIIETGYPKNDVLFNDVASYKLKIQEKYQLDSSSKIVLYAPTFRRDFGTQAYDLNVDSLTAHLQQLTGDKWHFVFRLHPNMLLTDIKNQFGENALNATLYPDLQELILGCDILITDYSSCMFDAAIAKKATFIYASDIRDYTDDRGFYFNLEDLPFPISQNTSELLKHISEFKQEVYLRNTDAFFKEVGLVDDGKATKRVADLVLKATTK